MRHHGEPDLFPSWRVDGGCDVGGSREREGEAGKEEDKKLYWEQDKKSVGAQVLLVPFIFQFEIFFMGALVSTCLVPYDE
jgi:hypothetical protein